MSAINMVDARKIIHACYEADEPLMLIGEPGTTKTANIEAVTQELDIGFIDFRLTLRDPVEVGGARLPDPKTGLLRHYIPDDLPDPKRHGPKGIVLFDEINVVSQLIQACAYGLIQERRNGSYRMAKGWVPMATGNNVKDKAAGQRISTALANRFNIQHVKAHLPSWLHQYGSEHVDSRGTAYLRFRPENFHCMPTSADQLSFPTARSWTKALKFIDKDPELRRQIFCGYLGETVADDFEAYWRIVERAVTIDQIIADPANCRVPASEDAGTYYAVAGMIARLVDRKNIDPIMVYVDRMERDYQVAIVQDATRRDKGLRNTQAYGAWAIKNQDVTL